MQSLRLSGHVNSKHCVAEDSEKSDAGIKGDRDKTRLERCRVIQYVSRLCNHGIFPPCKTTYWHRLWDRIDYIVLQDPFSIPNLWSTRLAVTARLGMSKNLRSAGLRSLVPVKLVHLLEWNACTRRTSQ